MLAGYMAQLKRQGVVRRYAIDPAIQNYLGVALRGIQLPHRVRNRTALGRLGALAPLIGTTTGALMHDRDPGSLAALIDLIHDSDDHESMLLGDLQGVHHNAHNADLTAFEPGRIDMVPPYTPFHMGAHPTSAVDALLNVLRPRSSQAQAVRGLRPGLMTMNLAHTVDLHELLDTLDREGLPASVAAQGVSRSRLPGAVGEAQTAVSGALRRSGQFMLGGGQ